MELPEWNEEQGCATDIPDLDPCWRVYPITHNPIFPPLWRMRAHRTILPDQLKAQVAEWKTWTQEVAARKHDDYLRKIHLHVTSDFLRYHWSFLRGGASASQVKAANWANKPELAEVRQEILLLPEPSVFQAPIDISERNDSFDEIEYANLFDQVRRLLELTRAWNSKVRGNWKLPNYTSSYYFTLDDFKKNACDEWLSRFFDWAERCIENGFGFYLDY